MSDKPALHTLQELLEEAGVGPIAAVERRPSPFRTSFPTEEIDLRLVDGEERRLLGKQLDWDGLSSTAQLAKPKFLHEPERELAVYRTVLPQAPSGPPRFFGSAEMEGEHWLFVERVEGRELFQVGERELWEQAARWLARFHGAMAPQLDRHRAEGRLLDHDAAFYRGWIERAERFANEREDGSTATVSWLRERHEQVVEALLALPRTVIHGEFYASNVLVASEFEHTQVGQKSEARVAPVDWELAAAGPGLSDLAALVSGWAQEDREAIAAAYADEGGVPSFGSRDLDIARLQVAIQWLGWAPPEWEPPEERRHDWLGEAVALAEELDL
jgi:thiamine kinase-like enzyme